MNDSPDDKYLPRPAAAAATLAHAAGPLGVAAIPDFLALAPVENDAERQRLDRLNDLVIAGTGWRQALAATQDAAMLRYVSDERRAAFIDLLPLDPRKDVLEIGPGLGQFTALLARRSRHVHALEVVPQQALFTALRTNREGVPNVSVAVGGDDCRLPYRDAVFDGVVLNLVFEWCGSRLVGETHASAQARLLAEMARVLRPGGFLYLTTKNRYALRLLLGSADEHMDDMRFGSALPRRLGSWLLRRRGQRRAMGLLHSHDRLRAEIERAGFVRLESFWAAPEMRFPAAYVPVDAASVRRARAQPGFVQGHERKVRWLMPWVPAGAVRHVMPGLCFLATRAGVEP